MATVTGTISHASEVPTRDVWIINWPAMGNADTGTTVGCAGSSDRCVQFSGTFGGATIVLQGSNDGTNWSTLQDPQGNSISKTSAGIFQVLDLTRYIRPVTSGGSGTSIDVNLLVKGSPV